MVIGLEREFAQKDIPEGFFAGTRTYAHVAIIGFMAGLLGVIYAEWMLLAITAGVAIMIARVFFLVFIFNRAMLNGFVLPLFVLFAAGVGITAYFNKKQKAGTQVIADIPLGDPLNLKDAIFFGMLYTGILILVSYANAEYGSKGIYISSLISGLTDIDAITISVSKLAGDTIDFLTAQIAVLIATLSNTIVKIGISISAGSRTLKKSIAIGYGIIFLAGIVGFLILNF